VKISIEKLRQKAAERPAGYLEDVLASGKAVDGWLQITPEAYQALTKKYSPERLRGLGDTVALIAKPVARAIDKIVGTDLERCPACAQRRAKLNAAFPFKKSS
jgi:hypothetical protein